MKKLLVREYPTSWMDFAECVQCEGLGVIWEEAGWDDEGMGQTGKNTPCGDCEGQGLIRVQPNILRV